VTEYLILDCDNTLGVRYHEIDDGLTLLYLLGRGDFELLGITTTFGNGPVALVTWATRQLLKSVKRHDLPVLQGAAQRGDVDTPAAHFLAEQIAKHPGAVTILTTGPLGNLRAAAEHHPKFFSKVKRIACMGGYLKPLRIGYRRLPERNLSGDPEATWAVLNAACPVTLMPAQLCLQASFTRRDFGLTRWDPTLHQIVKSWLRAFGFYCGVRRFYLWDLLPAVYLTHPHLFDAPRVRIGATVADLEKGMLRDIAPDADSQLILPTQIVDRLQFKALLFEAWGRVQVNGRRLQPLWMANEGKRPWAA